MILGFKETFPWGEPTHFREKIWAALAHITEAQVEGKEKTYALSGELEYHPKLHTIREDKHDRWKAGNSIQMVYRGPKYSIKDHFNKGIEELERCVSVQKIAMTWGNMFEKLTIHIDGKLFAVISCHPNVHVREPYLSNGLLLAKNDGFENVHDFAKWFKRKDFSGKIIHWTDFKY